MNLTRIRNVDGYENMPRKHVEKISTTPSSSITTYTHPHTWTPETFPIEVDEFEKIEITKIKPYQEILILFLSPRKSLKVMPNRNSLDLLNQKFIITHPQKINQKNTDSFEGRYV